MLDRLVSSPWFGIAGFVIGVLGLVLGVLFYVWSTRLKVPMFTMRSSLILAKHLRVRGLDVTLSGKSVEGNLILSNVSIWNRGAGVIEKSDIAAADPLRIEGVEGITIHDAWLLVKNHKPVNQPTVKLENGCILLGFDHLGKGEGFTVAMFRSSLVEKTTEQGYVAALDKELTVAGTLKGHQLTNYELDKRRYGDVFADFFLRPFGFLNRVPPWVAIPIGVLTLLPIVLALAPILALLQLLDGLRNVANLRTDRPYIS